MEKFKIGSIDKKCSKKGKDPKELEVMKSLIMSEFKRFFKDTFYSELEEGHYVFILSMLCYEMIEDFSEYGEELPKLDFKDYVNENDCCFLCYIKFDIEYFLEMMISWYEEILNN